MQMNPLLQFLLSRIQQPPNQQTPQPGASAPPPQMGGGTKGSVLGAVQNLFPQTASQIPTMSSLAKLLFA